MNQTAVIFKKAYNQYPVGTKGFIESYWVIDDLPYAIVKSPDGEFIPYIIPVFVLKEGHKL